MSEQIKENSAGLHMRAVKTQRLLGDSMMNGVKPESVELARALAREALDLLNVVEEENAAEVLREEKRRAAYLARRVSDEACQAGFGT
jgi:hypothetical protein